MQNKYKNKFVILILAMFVCWSANAAAPSVDEYQPAGTMFQMVADLEQEKLLLQLEKEKAQLQVDMDRLLAEQARIKNEMDAMSGAGDTQAQALELERKRIEVEKQKLDAEKNNIASDISPAKTTTRTSTKKAEPEIESPITEKYTLVEIIGAGRQIGATIVDNDSGQSKKISVGKKLDGWNVDSVSLDEGIVLSKDGETAILDIPSGK
ncbi:MAG: hypothetical protein LBL75_00595 [Rickettsiales bacterium]|jgi:hypothetical protein|nr:hypothetical protein [Rickettsiales bacterium]